MIPFSWEKGIAAIQQSVGSMKKMLEAIAGAQGLSKKPLPKMINKRRAAAKRKESALKKAKLTRKKAKPKAK